LRISHVKGLLALFLRGDGSPSLGLVAMETFSWKGRKDGKDRFGKNGPGMVGGGPMHAPHHRVPGPEDQRLIFTLSR
jgi:hypothetical protein